MRDLKHLIYFENLLDNADNELVEKEKAEGGLAIGYTCFHIPEVLLNVETGGPINFAKGVWRYRWVGQSYLPVLHWFDRGLQGMRGEALKASAWHYRAMVASTIRQFQAMFAADSKINGGKINDAHEHNIAINETVWGGIFYPWDTAM